MVEEPKQQRGMHRAQRSACCALAVHTSRRFKSFIKEAALRTMGKGKNRHRKRGSGGEKKGRRDDASQPDRNRRGNYVPMEKGNFKMECFYALQRLHHQRWDEDSACFVECASDGEREEERKQWRRILSEILPASFRITKDVPIYLQNKLEQELQTLLREATEYEPEKKDDGDGDGDVDSAAQEGAAGTQTAAPTNNEDPRRAPLSASEILSCRRLPFLRNAHQLGLDRSTIRKNPALQPLHAWLKTTTASGHVTRQETVSMVPPVLLAVRSTDAVLDMCAAPGSKTSQLLEDLSANTAEISQSTCTDTNTVTATATTHTAASAHGGVLVANDANAQRAQMLASQLRRILHHHPVALITAAPAQFFPSHVTQFDKILCDVPCSGDGTTRKNLGVWKNWGAVGALALHSLQLQIAVKGTFQLLRVGGTLCYSTCSFNPMENEAVVADLLRKSNGCLELVDCRHQLHGFKTRPGLSSWKVLCEDQSVRELRNRQKKQSAKMQARREEFDGGGAKGEQDDSKGERKGGKLEEMAADPENQATTEKGESVAASEQKQSVGGGDNAATSESNVTSEIDLTTNGANNRRKFEPTSLDDEATLLKMAEEAGLKYYASQSDVPPAMLKRIPQSAFPPTAEEAAQFHLERCLRCLPHDNDTGGFFVALLRKTAPMSATDRRAQQKGEASEPEEKKAKTGDEPMADDELPEGMEVDEEALEGLDPDNKPVLLRGQIKGNMAEGEDFGKDDFKRVSDDIIDPLIEYYGLTNGFDKGLYMSRACSESKVIYYIAKPVKHLFDLGIQKRVTIVNSGLKAFQRNRRSDNDAGISYRVCQEGIAFLLPFMTKRKVVSNLDDFRKCLSGNGKTVHLSIFSESFRAQLKELTSGAFAVVMEGYEDKLNDKLAATMWKCRGESIDGLVAKIEIDEILSKIDGIEKASAV